MVITKQLLSECQKRWLWDNQHFEVVFGFGFVFFLKHKIKLILFAIDTRSFVVDK